MLLNQNKKRIHEKNQKNEFSIDDELNELEDEPSQEESDFSEKEVQFGKEKTDEYKE